MLPGHLLPAFQLAIDWSHPLAQNLVSYCVADGSGGLIDLAKPRACTGGAAAFNSRGAATKNSASIANAAAADVNFTTAPFSAACVFNLNNTGLSQWIWGMGAYTDESHNSGWYFQAFGPAAIAVNHFNNNAAASYRQTAAATTVIGDMSCAFINDGTNRKIFVNGKLDSTSAALNVTCGSTSGGLGTGLFNSGTSELYVGAAWARVVSDSEMNLFHYDPLCLLRPLDTLMPALAVVIAPTGGLFVPSSLNGLGSGGNFFHNRLG